MAPNSLRWFSAILVGLLSLCLFALASASAWENSRDAPPSGERILVCNPTDHPALLAVEDIATRQMAFTVLWPNEVRAFATPAAGTVRAWIKFQGQCSTAQGGCRIIAQSVFGGWHYGDRPPHLEDPLPAF